MISMDNIHEPYESELRNVQRWVDDMYTDNFSKYFEEERLLFDRLKSKSHPITDEELIWILTILPLNLFDVSESLNRFKLSYEVLKLSIKQKEAEIKSSSTQTTESKKAEEAALAVGGDKLLLMAYNSITSRVDSEISFSRELIMSAKKIWDARRRTEQATVSETVPGTNLPKYEETGNNGQGRYIK